MKKKKIAPISHWASVIEKLDLGSIPCLAFSNKTGQREDSTVFNSKTKRFLCCLLSKATWWIQQNYKNLLIGHWCRPGAWIAWLEDKNKFWRGHEKFIYVNSRVWIKRKRWRPQTLVFISKFLQFSTIPKVRIKEKRSSGQKFPQIFVVILWCSTNSQVKAKNNNNKKVFVPKVSWNSVWVHKNYEKTVLAREF